MAVILLRHTRPVGGAGICYGTTDLPPGPDLTAEAARLDAQLPAVPQIVTSPLTRTCQLARAIGRQRGLPIHSDARLAELDFGRWEGVPWQDIPRPELDAWAADLMGYCGHGGESVAQLYDRVSAALSDLSDGTLVVTHAGVIRAARAWAGLPDPWGFRLDYGAWIELP